MELEFPRFPAYISDMFDMLFFVITIDVDVIYLDKDIVCKFGLEYSIHAVLEGGMAVAVSLL